MSNWRLLFCKKTCEIITFVSVTPVNSSCSVVPRSYHKDASVGNGYVKKV